MRLKKNRPYNHWLKSQGHYLLCFSTSRTVGANSVRLRHETRTRYSLKTTTKIPPPPTLENKNVPIHRSQNTQNTRTPLKTGSEQSVTYFLLDSVTLIHFRWINLKLALPQHTYHKIHSGKIKFGTYIAAHSRNRVIKLINNSSMNIIEYNSRSFLTMSSNQRK